MFERCNLDLMYGLPGQDLAMAEADLRAALALDPGHLSRYQLTLEPNTLFALRPPALPPEDLIWEMQTEGESLLAEAGYARYEVSAHARPGHEAQHNLNYWEFGDYLGIGAGAHSKLTQAAEGVVRQTVVRRPEDFMAKVVDGTHRRSEAVPAESLPFEFMLNALRLVEGVPVMHYPSRTGQPVEGLLAQVGQAQTDGLMSCQPGRFAPTPLGLNFLNDLQARFLPDAPK